MKRSNPETQNAMPGGNGGSGSIHGIPAEAVHGQLSKILGSQSFTHCDRLSRFLRFAVEQTLEGRTDRLKEYLLGVEVFDRQHLFSAGRAPRLATGLAAPGGPEADYRRTDHA